MRLLVNHTKPTNTLSTLYLLTAGNYKTAVLQNNSVNGVMLITISLVIIFI